MLCFDDQLSRVEPPQYGGWANAAEAAEEAPMADRSCPRAAGAAAGVAVEPAAAVAGAVAGAAEPVAAPGAAAAAPSAAPAPPAAIPSMGAAMAVVGGSAVGASAAGCGSSIMPATPAAPRDGPATTASACDRGGAPASPEAAGKLQALEQQQLGALLPSLQTHPLHLRAPSRHCGEMRHTPNPLARPQQAAAGQPFPAEAARPSCFVPGVPPAQAAAGAEPPVDGGCAAMHNQPCPPLSADDMDVAGGPEPMEH